MHSTARTGAPEWLIVIGSTVFVVVLAVSAWWDPTIRWLHGFQSAMYVATLWLSLHHRKAGLFIGASAAGLWAYGTLFVNTFLVSGLRALWAWVHTGRLTRPDLGIAVPAWTANLLVVIGCVWAYTRRCDKRPRDLAMLLLTFALTSAFFAADMALFQPRYLGLFRGLLHPHWP